MVLVDLELFGLVSSLVDFADFFFFPGRSREDDAFLDLELTLSSSSFLLEPPLGIFLTTHGALLLVGSARFAAVRADEDGAEGVVEEAVDAAHAARTIILFAERFFILATVGD